MRDDNVILSNKERLMLRFDELRRLEDGWLDGEGLAPFREGLDRVATMFNWYWPENIEYPRIFPTPEGNILFEWDNGSSLEILLKDLHGDFIALDDAADQVFDFNDRGQFFVFLNFIKSHLS